MLQNKCADKNFEARPPTAAAAFLSAMMAMAPCTLNSFVMLIVDRVRLKAENIADFGPSAQPINPTCQLKNIFVATNESLRPHSHFLFSNYITLTFSSSMRILI